MSCWLVGNDIFVNALKPNAHPKKPARSRSMLPMALAALLLLIAAVFVFSYRNTETVKLPDSPSNVTISRKSAGNVMDFVKIAPGEFVMGCSNGDTECFDSEKPAHPVRITKGFEMGKYDVTQAQWESVMGNNPSHFKGAERPVESVSWNDAQDFLRKLNARHDGYRYRLPTEAEWEYAARAGTASKYYGSPLDAIAWYTENSGNQTHTVGQKQPNGWGLYDMEGNVYQWVEDWYDANYYRSSPTTDPQGPATGQTRVLRGASSFHVARIARVSFRHFDDPTFKGIVIGFRCVREAVS